MYALFHRALVNIKLWKYLVKYYAIGCLIELGLRPNHYQPLSHP